MIDLLRQEAMIGKSILHYYGSGQIRLSPDKIFEKLGGGGIQKERDPAGKEGT